MAVKELLVGNLNVVYIGEKGKFDLLDFWDEISKFIFIDDISYGSAPKLLLKDVKIKKVGSEKDLAIYGRFVKSTVLSVKQVLEGNELKPRNERHDSAPSAVFVYLLKNHILLYWGEHPGYPSVKSFRTFISKCLNRERKKFIRVEQKGKKDEEKIEILSSYPEAYVSYIPLPLTKNLESQFSDVIKVNKLTVRQYYQNANINYRTVLSTNQFLMDAVKSQKLDYSLTGIENIEGTKDLVKKIAAAGDSEFKVDAKTEDGKKAITNDGIQYSQYFDEGLENGQIDTVADAMVGMYLSDVKNGDIPKVPAKNSTKLLDKVKENG